MEQERIPFYVFDTHVEAEESIRSLSRSGFDVKTLSLVGKGYHDEKQAVGYYALSDRIRSWGGVGGFWDGVWRLLHAPAVFLLPRLGLVAMAGPVVPALVGALEGAESVGDCSVLGAALARIGIPQHHVIEYEAALRADKYVLMVHGPAETTVPAVAVPQAAEQRLAA